MAVLSYNIAAPSDGSEVALLPSQATNLTQVSIRNTGTVTVLLGASGTEVFPLAANEFLGLTLGDSDALMCKVQTNGVAGQVTILAVG